MNQTNPLGDIKTMDSKEKINQILADWLTGKMTISKL